MVALGRVFCAAGAKVILAARNLQRLEGLKFQLDNEPRSKVRVCCYETCCGWLVKHGESDHCERLGFPCVTLSLLAVTDFLKHFNSWCRVKNLD